MPAAKYNTDTGLAKRKMDGLQRAKTMLLENPGALTFAEIAAQLDVDRTTAHRYMRELGAVADGHGHYTYVPTPEDIHLARLILGEPT